MHAYTTDESRVGVYAGMAVVAVVLAWAIVVLTSRFSWPEWLVSAPSLATTFAVVYQWFDRSLWRMTFFHRVGAVNVADISGTYEGRLVSTFRDSGGQPVERRVVFTINQSWTRISIAMEVTSETSSSVSTSALAGLSRDGKTTCLTYTYKNQINPGIADEDMGDHAGAADVRISPDGRLSGRYFNSRPRAGTIDARRTA